MNRNGIKLIIGLVGFVFLIFVGTNFYFLYGFLFSVLVFWLYHEYSKTPEERERDKEKKRQKREERRERKEHLDMVEKESYRARLGELKAERRRELERKDRKLRKRQAEWVEKEADDFWIGGNK